jgi:putative salt-induced outer membrane protein
MKKLVLVVLGLSAAFVARAEDKTFKGESEASAIVISGNSDSETYGAKTTNTWNLTESDLATIFGKYIRTKSAGTETAKAWEAGLRYERVFMKDLLNGFVQHKAEHDPYNGVFVQRDSTDIGAKYFFKKSDDLTWFGEFGYRFTSTYSGLAVPPATDKYNNDNLRAYTEASAKFNATTSGKVWVEYLANLKDSNKSLTNAEASVSVVMTSLLSFKTSILLNHNEGTVAPGKKDTTTWTTALVANY